jgi:hypothetical protein
MAESIPIWAQELGEDDWHFIRRFLLASGSLKDLAQQYGVSYPTIRARLDRLIEKVRILSDERPKSQFHRRLQVLVAEGKLDASLARVLLKAHEDEKRG